MIYNESFSSEEKLSMRTSLIAHLNKAATLVNPNFPGQGITNRCSIRFKAIGYALTSVSAFSEIIHRGCYHDTING